MFADPPIPRSLCVPSHQTQQTKRNYQSHDHYDTNVFILRPLRPMPNSTKLLLACADKENL
jgi:hypothetical protein